MKALILSVIILFGLFFVSLVVLSDNPPAAFLWLVSGGQQLPVVSPGVLALGVASFFGIIVLWWIVVVSIIRVLDEIRAWQEKNLEE